MPAFHLRLSPATPELPVVAGLLCHTGASQSRGKSNPNLGQKLQTRTSRLAVFKYHSWPRAASTLGIKTHERPHICRTSDLIPTSVQYSDAFRAGTSPDCSCGSRSRCQGLGLAMQGQSGKKHCPPESDACSTSVRSPSLFPLLRGLQESQPTPRPTRAVIKLFLPKPYLALLLCETQHTALPAWRGLA